MANRYWNQFLFSFHKQLVEIDCNFTVDSSNANGFGISGLKGPGVKNVYMQSAIAPSGSPALGLARSYAVFGASAVTNTGASVLTGNLGIYPGTAITGFPPGSFTGAVNATNGAALAAKTAAQIAYNDLSTRPSSVIATALDGQSLTAGVYSSAGGTFTLASAGAGALTLTGSASDIFVFQTATTLTTGAGGIPTITLAGGALASNVYWAVGSSATTNSGFTGVFQGSIIANTSITNTLGGTVNGSLIALNGAVTLSAATNINVQSFAGGSSPAVQAGAIVVQLADNYNKLFSEFSTIVSPSSGTALKVDNSALVAGSVYQISTLGSSTAAQWVALGVPIGVTPAVGVSFVALSVGAGANTSTSRVMAPLAAGSGISSIEFSGNPNLSVNPNPTVGQTFGAQFILQARDFSGAVSAPVDGSIISLTFLLSNSSVSVNE